MARSPAHLVLDRSINAALLPASTHNPHLRMLSSLGVTFGTSGDVNAMRGVQRDRDGSDGVA